jgi:hypothetical protein
LFEKLLRCHYNILRKKYIFYQNVFFQNILYKNV